MKGIKMRQMTRTFATLVATVFMLSSYSIPMAMAQEAPQVTEVPTTQELYMADTETSYEAIIEGKNDLEGYNYESEAANEDDTGYVEEATEETTEEEEISDIDQNGDQSYISQVYNITGDSTANGAASDIQETAGEAGSGDDTTVADGSEPANIGNDETRGNADGDEGEEETGSMEVNQEKFYQDKGLVIVAEDKLSAHNDAPGTFENPYMAAHTDSEDSDLMSYEENYTAEMQCAANDPDHWGTIDYTGFGDYRWDDSNQKWIWEKAEKIRDEVEFKIEWYPGGEWTTEGKRVKTIWLKKLNWHKEMYNNEFFPDKVDSMILSGEYYRIDYGNTKSNSPVHVWLLAKRQKWSENTGWGQVETLYDLKEDINGDTLMYLREAEFNVLDTPLVKENIGSWTLPSWLPHADTSDGGISAENGSARSFGSGIYNSSDDWMNFGEEADDDVFAAFRDFTRPRL